MLGSGKYLKTSRDLFAGQFEPQGEGYLYRYNQRDAPIPVSAAERDRFIAQFERDAGRRFWGMMLALAIVLPSLLIGETVMGLEPSVWRMVLVIFCLLAVQAAVTRRVWRIPAQQLRGRAAVGAARSGAEMRRRMLESVSYSHIVVGLLIGAFFLLRLDPGQDLPSGDNLFWLVLGTGMTVLVLIQLYRKWRLTRAAGA